MRASSTFTTGKDNRSSLSGGGGDKDDGGAGGVCGDGGGRSGGGGDQYGVGIVMMVEIHLQSFILQQSQQLLVEQLGFRGQELGHLIEERVVGHIGSHNICIFPLRINLVG